MRELNDIRPGNYIKTIYNDGLLDEPLEVKKIDQKNGMIEHQNGSDQIDSLTAITLNEEWLGRFRFELTTGEQEKKKYIKRAADGTEFLISQDKDAYSGSYWKFTEADKIFKYVHQLQNHYYDKTGEKLIFDYWNSTPYSRA